MFIHGNDILENQINNVPGNDFGVINQNCRRIELTKDLIPLAPSQLREVPPVFLLLYHLLNVQIQDSQKHELYAFKTKVDSFAKLTFT